MRKLSNKGPRSYCSKIILILLSLFIFEKGWVTQTHPFAILETCAAVKITSELMYAIAFAGVALYRACTNSNDSEIERTLKTEISRLSSSASICADKPLLAVEHVTPIQHAISEEEKHVSEQLTYTVVTDWNKQVEQNNITLLRSAHSGVRGDMYEKVQVWSEGHTKTVDANGTTYRSSNNKFYVRFGTSPRHNHPGNDTALMQQQERLEIRNNPALYSSVQNVVYAFVENARVLVYGSFIDRIMALLTIPEFYIEGTSYGLDLYNAQRKLYAAYFHKDGRLCIKSLHNMSTARTILLEYDGINKNHRELFQNICALSSSESCKKPIKKSRKVSDATIKLIKNNPINRRCKKMLGAFLAGNMQQAEICKNKQPQSRDLVFIYNALKAEHDTIVKNIFKKQEALLKDAFGILHFNLPAANRDPLFTRLSPQERERFKNNPARLKELNEALIVRNFHKNAFHKAWRIPLTISTAVHQALYALLNCQTPQERIDKIHSVASNSSLTHDQQQEIVQALFLPNGIIKDFASYDRAQTLKMPVVILSVEHAKTRRLLNQLVYLERICNDQQFQAQCAAAIECIQYAVDADIDDFNHQVIMLFNEQQQPTDNSGKTPHQNQLPEQKDPKKDNNNPISPGAAAITLLKAVEDSKEKAAEVFQKTCEYLTTDGGAARVAHAFRAECDHNFGPLFARMGADINSTTDEGKRKIFEVGAKIIMNISQKLLEMGTKLAIDADGIFREILVEYEGELITVRGRIHEGIIKTGTMFIQKQHVRLIS